MGYSNGISYIIISENKGIIENLADLCFLPVLYFSGGKGRVYEILNKKVVSEEVLFPKTSCGSQRDQALEYLKTATAIVTYIPGIIIGYLAKSFAMLFDSSINERQEIVAAYIAEHSDGETHVTKIETPEITVEIPKAKTETLETIHTKLKVVYKAIWDKIEKNAFKEDYDTVEKDQVSFNCKAAELWQTEEMVQLADTFMKLMVEETQIFIKELRSDGKDDPKEMAPLLENQRNKSVNGKYCWKFFAMTGMYHTIRSMEYVVPHPHTLTDDFLSLHAIETREGGKRTINPELEARFFEKGTKQYKWRQYYNYFCNQFSDIFPYMTDDRFENWTKPDMEKGIFRGQPDTMPT